VVAYYLSKACQIFDLPLEIIPVSKYSYAERRKAYILTAKDIQRGRMIHSTVDFLFVIPF
jgi:hypothetical protein